MTKEQLQNELENYKRLYKVEQQKAKQLLEERENIEEYRKLNLGLQVELENLKNENKEIIKNNQILGSRNQTYENVFNLLKKEE